METVGTNALASLNVSNLQVNPKNQRNVHCPHPNGYGYVSIVGYTDTSFSKDSTDTASFLHTQGNQTRIATGTSVADLVSKGVAVIPAGHVPVQVKVDNNQDTIAEGSTLQLQVSYQAGYTLPPTVATDSGNLSVNLTKLQCNSGVISIPQSGSVSPSNLHFGTGNPTDYPIIIGVSGGSVTNGQVRVTILCIPVSGTTYA